jgi:metal-sulfur cluster biosynthetic enzyme
MMSDDRERHVNPHTGQPIPDEPFAPEAEGAGAAFAADVRNAPAESHPAAASPPVTGAAAAPSQQELAVRSALETVMDPEISLSVIDLGLIREVLFHADPPRTQVRMMLTTPFCPYAPQLIEDVKQATMSVVPQPCEVEIMADPWSPDLMPDPGLLGYSF